MAGFAALAATSKAILGLLEMAAASDPAFADVTFALFGTADLQEAPAGKRTVSLYLHHIAVNAARGSMGPRTDSTGQRRRPGLALEMHYLLTAWATLPEAQQRLLGWCVRVLHETPTLPAGVLNRHTSGDAFRPDETVEIVWENLTEQVVLDVWDVARKNIQPSATYLARIVEIEPLNTIDEHPLVQTRDIRYGKVPVR